MFSIDVFDRAVMGATSAMLAIHTGVLPMSEAMNPHEEEPAKQSETSEKQSPHLPEAPIPLRRSKENTVLLPDFLTVSAEVASVGKVKTHNSDALTIATTFMQTQFTR